MALKTLVDCKPSEFLRQTNLIRKSVERWLTVTDIMNIRKRLPKFEVVPESTTAEESAEIVKRNAAAKMEQAKKNLSAILDAMLEKHPDETLEVLALCCFVEPKDADKHPMGEYLTAFAKLIGDEAVIGFFTSLMRLAQTGILNQ